MAHSRIRPKVRRRKVAQLAARSKQFSVNNNTIPQIGLNAKNTVRIWHEVRTTKFDTPIYGKLFEIDEKGQYHLVEREFDPTPMIIAADRKKIGKRLMKLKKRKYSKKHETTNGVGGIMMVQNTKPGRQKRNDFLYFKNYPYNLPKMNKVEYMEKLVEHKTAKWERKHPKPYDMYTEEVERWKQERETAIERIRDFVVSVYDKLLLTGRFKISENKYNEEKIADIKDINGEGHHVNELPASSKLIKKAQKTVNETKAKHASLVAGNLRDHKKQKGRIILPQAA